MDHTPGCIANFVCFIFKLQSMSSEHYWILWLQVNLAVRLNTLERSMYEVWQQLVTRMFLDILEFMKWSFSNSAPRDPSLFRSAFRDLLTLDSSPPTSDLMAYLRLSLWSMEYESQLMLIMYIWLCHTKKNLLLFLLALPFVWNVHITKVCSY